MLLKTGLHALKALFLLFLFFSNQAVQALPAMAMGYTPKYTEDFKHFDYVDPAAKKGGKLVLSGFGTFDSLNPYILKGIAAEGLGLIFESLLEKSLDEPFSAYGLLADDVALADDKLSVVFRLNPDASGVLKAGFKQFDLFGVITGSRYSVRQIDQGCL